MTPTAPPPPRYLGLVALYAAWSVALWSCVDKLSDDCRLTLSCPSSTRALDAGLGPRDAAVDASGDGGAAERQVDCRVEGCDPADRLCHPESHQCVECYETSHCEGDQPACNLDSGRCVECTADADCQDVALPACRAQSNTCVECQSDAQCGRSEVCNASAGLCTSRCLTPGGCPQAGSYCDVDRELCVACLEDAHCDEPDAPQCDTRTGQCVQCVNDTPCGGEAPACETQSHRCVACTATSGTCTSPGALACSEQNTCVECASNADCTTRENARCDLSQNRCAPCAGDSACPLDAPNCRMGDHLCVVCVSNEQCGGDTPFCRELPSSGECVACLESDDCTAADRAYCNADNECSPCTQDDDCASVSGGRSRCRLSDQSCVQCRIDGHCLDPKAARCDDGSCAACQGPADCSHLPDRQACDTEAGECVECVADADCAGNPSGSVCDPSARQCVQCLENADCTDPGASRCNTGQHVCVACQDQASSSDCAHLGATPICSTDPEASDGSTKCVQCTSAQSALCGGNVCDTLAKVCSTEPAGSAGDCDACVADAQCEEGLTCAPDLFNGAPQGFRCFPRNTGGGCLVAPFGSAQQATNIDGAAAAICGHFAGTTCAALQKLADPCDEDADCSTDGLTDGACINAVACSVPCLNAFHCGVDLACDDATGDPRVLCRPD